MQLSTDTIRRAVEALTKHAHDTDDGDDRRARHELHRILMQRRRGVHRPTVRKRDGVWWVDCACGYGNAYPGGGSDDGWFHAATIDARRHAETHS